MPKYEVTLKEVRIYSIPDIIAETEKEAIEKGWKILEDNDGARLKYFHDEEEGDCFADEAN